MKPLLIALFLFLLGTVAVAQKNTRDFVLEASSFPTTHSLYHYIELLDSRIDTSHYGIIQTGAFNKKARLVPKVNLQTQLNRLFPTLIGNGSGTDTLLLQLRDFSLAEITGYATERGYAYLRLALYAKKDDGYRPIALLDTAMVTKGMDVTVANKRKASKALMDFVNAHVGDAGSADTLYNLQEVKRIDSIEKTVIPLYTQMTLKDGVYNSFEAFRNQVPDEIIPLEVKQDGNTIAIQALNGSKRNRLKAKNVYAVVDKSQPYIATDYGFYRMDKQGEDFYFTGKAQVTANTGDIITAGLFFGIAGGLIASGANATFDMKLDHLNGGFVRLREVQVTP